MTETNEQEKLLDKLAERLAPKMMQAAQNYQQEQMATSKKQEQDKLYNSSYQDMVSNIREAMSTDEELKELQSKELNPNIFQALMYFENAPPLLKGILKDEGFLEKLNSESNPHQAMKMLSSFNTDLASNQKLTEMSGKSPQEVIQEKQQQEKQMLPELKDIGNNDNGSSTSKEDKIVSALIDELV